MKYETYVFFLVKMIHGLKAWSSGELHPMKSLSHTLKDLTLWGITYKTHVCFCEFIVTWVHHMKNLFQYLIANKQYEIVKRRMNLKLHWEFLKYLKERMDKLSTHSFTKHHHSSTLS
jgi:hypothetical protein